MNASWYDLLDVEDGATAAQIKVAWKAAIADLDPTDRRFRLLNQAAEVLLDPARRAAHDADLAEAAKAEDEPPVVSLAKPDAGPGDARVTADGTARPGGVPSWLLAGLAGLTAVTVAAATWVGVAFPSNQAVESAAADAERAAEQAATTVFAYDHTRLDADHDAAVAHMTEDYAGKYDELFPLIEENAPRTQTKVTVEFVASGLVRAGSGREADERVQVFVMFDQIETNKADAEPSAARNFATLTMERVGGEWLVDDVTGPPAQQAPTD